MRSSDARIMRLGVITLALLGLIMAATFNLGKFPGFGGNSYEAEFTDASGIRRGNIVQIGGIRVGRVQDVTLDKDKVLVKFEIDKGVEFGPDSGASVEVLNLLGEKYLDVSPAGEGQMAPGERISLERTESAYDIIGVFGDLTETTEAIDKEQLKNSFNVLSDTVDAAAPEIQASLEGISRLSNTIATRDAEIKNLFNSSKKVSEVLARRSDDLVKLMGNADLVFQELNKRREAIHQLLVNARVLSEELRGLAKDNEKQIAPALKELDDLLDSLISKEKGLKATLNALGPYAAILSNIIGTGPWFDAYAANLAALPTGEFLPGNPQGTS